VKILKNQMYIVNVVGVVPSSVKMYSVVYSVVNHRWHIQSYAAR